MKINIWWIFALITMISLGGNLCFGQPDYSPGPNIWQTIGPPPPTIPFYQIQQIFKDGINVEIAADSLAQKWGIEIEKLNDAAIMGVKAAGWDFNPSSEKVISITIDSSMSKNDSVQCFKIEANGIRRLIDLKKNDNGLMTTSINQIVRNIADRMRREIIKENTMRPDPLKSWNNFRGWE